MIINSLEQMEKIVKSNYQLSWDGWDVIHRVPVRSAWMKPNGVYHKGKWFIQSRFPITSDGWKLPNKLAS